MAKRPLKLKIPRLGGLLLFLQKICVICVICGSCLSSLEKELFLMGSGFDKGTEQSADGSGHDPAESRLLKGQGLDEGKGFRPVPAHDFAEAYGHGTHGCKTKNIVVFDFIIEEREQDDRQHARIDHGQDGRCQCDDLVQPQIGDNGAEHTNKDGYVRVGPFAVRHGAEKGSRRSGKGDSRCETGQGNDPAQNGRGYGAEDTGGNGQYQLALVNVLRVQC